MKRQQPTFSELDLSPVGDGANYRLKQPLLCIDSRGNKTVIPEGFVTDLASVPDIARIGLVVLLAGWFLNVSAIFILGAVIVWFAGRLDDKAATDKEAILHDWRYFCGGGLKAFLHANAELYHGMRVRNPWPMCAIYWLNITLFGCFAWWADARKRAKHE